jgi:hypothetical protein
MTTGLNDCTINKVFLLVRGWGGVKNGFVILKNQGQMVSALPCDHE